MTRTTIALSFIVATIAVGVQTRGEDAQVKRKIQYVVPSPYDPMPSASQPDRPASVGGTSSHESDGLDLSLKKAKDSISQMKEKLSAGKPASPSEQSECLRLAAVLAELGGLEKDAKHLRDEAEKDRPPLSVMEVLAHRQAELDALQKQVAALRRMTRTEQQVMVEVKMIEVRQSATKALFGSSEKRLGVIDSDRDLLAKLDDLRTKGVAKVLAEPTLITVSGRPAFFQSGGELPFVQNQNVGFKKYGTQVDLLPLALGNDKLRLDAKVRVSFVDSTISVTTGGVTTPGLNVREVDTGVEMKAGQTLVIAGLTQSREPTATPKPSDDAATEKPFAENATEQVELFVLLRATLIKDGDAAQAASVAPAASVYSSRPSTKTK